MTVLLDENVLVALVVDDHVHHSSAETWFLGVTDGFATCPITQGSLTRLLIRDVRPPKQHALSCVASRPTSGTSSGPDDITYADIPTAGIIGRRRVTDAYLAQLARSTSRLATFDQSLAKIHADVADLVPTG